MNTEMNLQRISIDKLKPAKYNPRKDLKPGDPAYEKIRRSLNDFGYVDPVIWNEVTGNIVGGHQRYKVLKPNGFARILAVLFGGIHIAEWRKMRKLTNVIIAGKSFILSGNRNIAAGAATLVRDTEGMQMSAVLTKEQFDRECGYRLALSIMNSLREKGLITSKEYGHIEQILAQKFSPGWGGYPDVISDK